MNSPECSDANLTFAGLCFICLTPVVKSIKIKCFQVHVSWFKVYSLLMPTLKMSLENGNTHQHLYLKLELLLTKEVAVQSLPQV